MALTVYRSSDTGAPAVGETAGSLILLIDACLRTGYGSKAGAGWTKPYTATNIAVFKQGAGGNNRFLRVWDARAGLDGNNLRSALIRGYEAMTAVSTGTNPFPTTGQVATNGLYVGYRASGQTTQNWILRATSSWFDLVIDTLPDNFTPGTSTTRNCGYMAFGNFPSFKAGDTYNEYIAGGRADTTPCAMFTVDYAPEVFVTRSDTGGVGSVQANFHRTAYTDENNVGAGTPAMYPYPNRPDSALLMQPYGIYAGGYPRGTAPGMWGALHGGAALGGADMTFSGQGALAGKSFVVGCLGSGVAWPILETSDTFTSL